jgi:hypothetical protein
LVGILFIAATVASTVAQIILDPILGDDDFLTTASVDQSQTVTAAIFETINNLAVVAIAIALYPILRRFNDRLALTYVAARTIESVLFFITTLHLLELVTVSEQFIDAGSPADSHYQTLGDALLAGSDWDKAHLAFIVFTLGALLLNYLLYRTRLVPRWLSIAGLVAAAIHLFGMILGMYGTEASEAVQLVVIDMPILVQEMVFALWLIIRGFDPSVLSEQPEAVEAPGQTVPNRRREPGDPSLS